MKTDHKPYNTTVRLSTKGQLQLPKGVRVHLGITPGTKINIYPDPQGDGFVATIHRKSRIMDFAGDLKDLKISGLDQKEAN